MSPGTGSAWVLDTTITVGFGRNLLVPLPRTDIDFWYRTSVSGRKVAGSAQPFGTEPPVGYDVRPSRYRISRIQN
jgi:hypothetical protein